VTNGSYSHFRSAVIIFSASNNNGDGLYLVIAIARTGATGTGKKVSRAGSV
jgi:hypothetical protein